MQKTYKILTAFHQIHFMLLQRLIKPRLFDFENNIRTSVNLLRLRNDYRARFLVIFIGNISARTRALFDQYNTAVVDDLFYRVGRNGRPPFTLHYLLGNANGNAGKFQANPSSKLLSLVRFHMSKRNPSLILILNEVFLPKE